MDGADDSDDEYPLHGVGESRSVVCPIRVQGGRGEWRRHRGLCIHTGGRSWFIVADDAGAHDINDVNHVAGNDDLNNVNFDCDRAPCCSEVVVGVLGRHLGGVGVAWGVWCSAVSGGRKERFVVVMDGADDSDDEYPLHGVGESRSVVCPIRVQGGRGEWRRHRELCIHTGGRSWFGFNYDHYVDDYDHTVVVVVYTGGVVVGWCVEP
jgi:hypothetical protein